MHNRLWKRRVAAAAIAGAIVVAPAKAFADEGSDLKAKYEDVNKRNSWTRTQLDNNDFLQNKLVNELADYNRNIAVQSAVLAETVRNLDAANAQKAQLEKQLADIQAKLQKTGKELGDAKKKLREREEKLGIRVRGIYKNGKASYLEALVDSISFRELVNRFAFLQYIGGRDAELVKKVTDAKNAVEVKERKQREQKKNVQAKQTAVDTEVVRIDGLLKKQGQGVLALQAQRAERQGLIDKLKNDKVALLAVQKAEEVEADALTKKINEWSNRAAASSRGEAKPAAPAPAAQPSSGGWVWPAGGRDDITSGFGPRTSPTAGASSNHPGIDFGMPEGTPIKAARNGTVVSAGDGGGYGNLTVIDHGGGITSAYAHQSQITVSPGQQVQAGQVIGYVGSTGVSTGPHLHFEIRVDGEPQNPLNWYGG